MADFFKNASERAGSLSIMESGLLDYSLKNLHLVKNMSIRKFAAANYVSTSTVIRFLKKMGYEGWSAFRTAIIEAESENRSITIPTVVTKDNYRESYMKNVVEAIRVLPEDKIEQFDQIMSRYPKTYILGEGFSREVGHYLYRLLKVSGYDCEFPQNDYEMNSLLRRIKREDVVIILSFSGENLSVIGQVQKILSIATPTLISITRADNNTIQNMSDINFYVFADEIRYDNMDVTSRCGMIAILELLMYRRITHQNQSQLG